MSENKDKIVDDQVGEKIVRKTLFKTKNKLFISFTFNKNQTILFVGCVQRLKLFGFNTIFKLIQILRMPTIIVNQILFMKKSNLLVLGNNDGMLIYNLDQNYQWKLHQKLQNHSDEITCILNNENEDLLITGSLDKTITIWKKYNLSWNCQQTIQTVHRIVSLSLNSSETTLISCGDYSDIIIVIQFQNNSECTIIQSIQVNEKFNNIFFVSENKFIRINQSEIQIYEQKEKQFILIQQQLYKGCSRCENVSSYLIKQKNILIIRCNCFTNYFMRESNQNFVLQYLVKPKYLSNFQIHEDTGKFLASWNSYQNFLNNYLIQGFQIDFIKSINEF